MCLFAELVVLVRGYFKLRGRRLFVNFAHSRCCVLEQVGANSHLCRRLEIGPREDVIAGRDLTLEIRIYYFAQLQLLTLSSDLLK